MASPSRGLDHQLSSQLGSLNLTEDGFQLKYFDWVQTRISSHYQAFPNRLDVNLHRAQFPIPSSGPGTSSPLIDPQLQSLGTLIREMRKLREGIVASHRSDCFAIRGAVIYLITKATDDLKREMS